VPIYKTGYKTDCSNGRGISFLSTIYASLSNISLSKLIPYAEVISGDLQCGFRLNISTTDHTFCLRQILEKSGNTMRRFIGYLWISRKLMIQLGAKSRIIF
jgi:hypothetical protein